MARGRPSALHRRPPQRIGHGWLLTLLGSALCLLLVSSPSGAHSFGKSSFTLKTDGADVRAVFHLDGQSVADLIERLHPEVAQTEGFDRTKIPDYAAGLLAYVDPRLRVSRGGQPCQRQGVERLSYIGSQSQVFFETRYHCGKDSSQISVQSELFLDEKTPHQVLMTLIHERAMERYFFTGGERSADIDLGALRQREARAVDTGGGVRVATPPPGAFDTAPGPRTAVPPAGESTDAIGSGFTTFFRDGIQHIFLGIDHVLFVLSLLLVTRAWRDLAVVITGFTIAHSITLALGALEVVIISPRVVEPIIAASIVYVAVENVFRAVPRHRFAVTFGFGLIHGLGFSQGLRDLGLTTGESLWPPLLGFNLGVEAAQLLIVLPLFPLLLWLQRHERHFRALVVGASGVIATVALWWFVERVFL